MSISIKIVGVTSCETEDFKKHKKAVEFCIENRLSYPKETSEYFKGCIDGEDLEDIETEFILKYIEHGKEQELKLEHDDYEEKIINMKDVPKDIEKIIISLEC